MNDFLTKTISALVIIGVAAACAPQKRSIDDKTKRAGGGKAAGAKPDPAAEKAKIAALSKQVEIKGLDDIKSITSVVRGEGLKSSLTVTLTTNQSTNNQLGIVVEDPQGRGEGQVSSDATNAQSAKFSCVDSTADKSKGLSFCNSIQVDFRVLEDKAKGTTADYTLQVSSLAKVYVSKAVKGSDQKEIEKAASAGSAIVISNSIKKSGSDTQKTFAKVAISLRGSQEETQKAQDAAGVFTFGIAGLDSVDKAGNKITYAAPQVDTSGFNNGILILNFPATVASTNEARVVILTVDMNRAAEPIPPDAPAAPTKPEAQTPTQTAPPAQAPAVKEEPKAPQTKEPPSQGPLSKEMEAPLNGPGVDPKAVQDSNAVQMDVTLTPNPAPAPVLTAQPPAGDY